MQERSLTMRNIKIKSKLEVQINDEIFCEVLKDANAFNFYKKNDKHRDYVYDYEPTLEEWIKVLNACWEEKLTALHEMFDFAECHSDLNICFGKFLPSQLRMASLSSINFEREANLCGLINEYIFENGETEEVKKFREEHNSDEVITKSKMQWSKLWLQRN